MKNFTLHEIMHNQLPLKDTLQLFNFWSKRHAIDHWFEYPSSTDKLNGIKDGSAWLYLSDTYLNGLINFTEIICGVGKIGIGAAECKREIYVKNLHTLASVGSGKGGLGEFAYYSSKGPKFGECLTTNGFHTNVSDTDYFPHMQILAMGAESYWYFDSDMDGADSGLARFKDDIFTDTRQASEWFVCYNAEDYIYEDADINALFLKYTASPETSLYQFVMDHVCDKYLVCIPANSFTGWITL